MKKSSFFFTALLLILNLCLSNGFAQDYTQWRLPDGAKARIGKGKIKDINWDFSKALRSHYLSRFSQCAIMKMLKNDH